MTDPIVTPEPEHGDLAQCTICHEAMEFLSSPSGSWWAHLVHPADGHDAQFGVAPEPNDADLARIEGDAVIAHWSGDAIAIGNASQIDILNAGRRGLFNAGFAVGRATVPTRDELADTLMGLLDLGKSHGQLCPCWTRIAAPVECDCWVRPRALRQADAVLAFLNTKGSNR